MPQAAVIEPADLNIFIPPTQNDLPSDDGMPMETERHKLQMDLLIYPLKPWINRQPEGGYVGGNMFVYFSMEQVRNQDFRGPDVFIALEVPRSERKSWVVWEEGKGPDVVIELLSEQTAHEDKGRKKRVYQNQLRVAEYFWFDPFDPDDWAGFELAHGIYQPLAPDAQGRLISRRLNLALIRWRGAYADVEATWLRWATLEGDLLPTDQETLAAAMQRADQERQRADAEAQRAAAAEAEVARLRALLAGQTGSAS
ncbi:MAG: Uma2 family endonuclease [Candidatus Contendobacter sp.]|nr:Uma2 family endonuclease [Candidatus Contendobacter sp.]MDG4559112.1 Uma2 family endonuclease [Candidatus Contendobacter sp.]